MPQGDATELTYIRAVNAALRWGLEQHPETVVFGEDVAIPGGPFGASKGLLKDFGDRVFDTPISESAMVGAALGMAMDGMRPIVEVMYGDFLLVAMDQIVNQVANTRYVSNGRAQAPLVIRTQQGATPGSCAQHSQSLEALFAHIAGLRVAVPSTPDDAYQMLRTAIVSDDPVLVMESRRLYPTKGPVRLDDPVEPLGRARVIRPGADLTIVCWGTSVGLSVEAAATLSSHGIEAEVLDLRWADPIDHDAVEASARKTGNLLVVHEANRTGGLGAEVVASAVERAGPAIRRTGRVATPDMRMPAAPTLSAAVLPSAERVVASARDLLNPDSPPRNLEEVSL